MAFGNYGAGYYQPNYYNPAGAVPDTLNQYKGQYQSQTLPQNPLANPQTNNGLLWVQGEAGAKSYLIAPGQSLLLMDSEATRFYIKSADNSGMPLPLRTFEYTEITEGRSVPQDTVNLNPSPMDRYVTRDEFNEAIAKITNINSALKEETENA